jgi:hypothetical protein
MPALEVNTSLIYGVHLRESANDGSDFTNAASDYRVLFLGEDGYLHVKDSAGSVTEPFDAGGAGDDLIPTVEQYVANGTGSGTSLACTISAAAVGKRIVVLAASNARDINTPTCTNTTFTEVGNANFSTTVYVSVYVGVVAGSPSGTSVGISATGANVLFMDTWVIDDALTPTAGSAVTLTDTNVAGLSNSRALTGAFTRGTFYAFIGAEDNGSTALRYSLSAPHAPGSITNAFVTALGYAPGGSFTAVILAGTTNADFAGGLFPIT